jgi:hypothetical protein
VLVSEGARMESVPFGGRSVEREVLVSWGANVLDCGGGGSVGVVGGSVGAFVGIESSESIRR